MRFKQRTIEGIFIERPDRFRAYVKIAGEIVLCHVPNTGRLKEILVAGVRCLVRLEDNPLRKTQYSLIGAWKDGFLINFDSQVPNKVVEEALIKKKIKELRPYPIIEREKTYGDSRFDFRLSNNEGGIYFLEVKGVTLEFDKVVSFPDAVTKRGAKHLLELSKVKKEGYGAGVLFLVQMEEALYFRPYYERDKEFSKALKLAKESGVDIFAYTCTTRRNSLTLREALPVVVAENDKEVDKIKGELLL